MALAFPLWPGTLSQCVGPCMHCPPIVCALHDVSVESPQLLALPLSPSQPCRPRAAWQSLEPETSKVNVLTSSPLSHCACQLASQHHSPLLLLISLAFCPAFSTLTTLKTTLLHILLIKCVRGWKSHKQVLSRNSVSGADRCHLYDY